MKKSVLISFIVGLVILLIAGSIFAFPRNTPGKVGGAGFNMAAPRYNQNVQVPRQPEFCMGTPMGLGLGFGRPFDSEEMQEFAEARMKLVFAEVLNAMDLSKEQAEKIYNVLNEAKTELQQISEKLMEKHEEAYQAAVKGDDKALDEIKEDIQDLLEERAEIIEEALEKVKSEITVEQLEKLMNQFGFQNRFRFNEKIAAGIRNRAMNLRGYVPGFIFTDEFMEVLQDFIGG
jgi:uncharacterized lipoprotein YehR (DUF1307 family)